MLIKALVAAAKPLTPSVDCARAASLVERTICANTELAVRGRAVAMLYRRLPASFTNVLRVQQR